MQYSRNAIGSAFYQYPKRIPIEKYANCLIFSFLDLHLFISGGFVKTKIYDKRDD